MTYEHRKKVVIYMRNPLHSHLWKNKKTASDKTLILDFQPPETEKINVWGLIHSMCGIHHGSMRKWLEQGHMVSK